MDQMTHEAPGPAADPDAGMKTSGAHGSHDRHAGHSVAMFRDKFWLSFGLTVPVVFWSMDVQQGLGYTAPLFPGSKFIPAILGTVVFFYGGPALSSLGDGELHPSTPRTLALTSPSLTLTSLSP